MLFCNIDKVNKENCKEWIDKVCIYGIYVDDMLVYIGQTRNLYNRVQSHKTNIVRLNSRMKIYKFLYKCYKQKVFDISFGIIEDVGDKQFLDDLEKYFIKKYNPILNSNSKGV